MSISARLKHLKRLDLYRKEKPFQVFINIPEDSPDQRYSNLEFEENDVLLNDIRATAIPPSLDNDGFTFKPCLSNLDLESFKNRDIVENVYLKELESLIRAEDDSISRIFWFEWRLRSSEEREMDKKLDLNDYTVFLRPAMEVHVDQSPAAVLHRIKVQLRDEADELLKGRVRILNFWKPLIDTVDDYPLALCDPKTVSPGDLAAADHVRREFVGETWYLHYNKTHSWYYLSQQHPNEVLILKMFDSKKEVGAKFCPHSSVKMPNPKAGAPPRRTIEARALIFSSLIDACG